MRTPVDRRALLRVVHTDQTSPEGAQERSHRWSKPRSGAAQPVDSDIQIMTRPGRGGGGTGLVVPRNDSTRSFVLSAAMTLSAQTACASDACVRNYPPPLRGGIIYIFANHGLRDLRAGARMPLHPWLRSCAPSGLSGAAVRETETYTDCAPPLLRAVPDHHFAVASVGPDRELRARDPGLTPTSLRRYSARCQITTSPLPQSAQPAKRVCSVKPAARRSSMRSRGMERG